MTNFIRRLLRLREPEIPTVEPLHDEDLEREREEACAAFHSAVDEFTMAITGPVDDS